MDSFDVQICSVFGKEYLRVDLADLTILEQVRAFLSDLDCVHHANISEGKRKHITVYLQSFYSMNDSYSLVEKALKEFGTKKQHKAQIQEPQIAIREDNISKSQLDRIPTGVPVAFISYSYDDEAHREWVRKLSNDLRNKGVFTLLDQYEPAGTDLTDFMKKGIARADKVIIIGTPNYAKKVNQESSGAHFEDQIMTIEMYNGVKYKFVPILKSGKFNESFPLLLGSKKGFDFSNDDNYTSELQKLADDIKGITAESIPPVVIPENKETIMHSADDNLIPTSGLKTYLKKKLDPYQGEKWLEKLLNAFDTYAMDRFLEEMPFKFEAIILKSYDFWNASLNASAFTIHDQPLKSKIEDFFMAWKSVNDLTVHCYILQTDNYYQFDGLKHDEFVSNDKEEAFIELLKRVKQLEGYYTDLIKYIKTNYPQIDLDETSNSFRNENRF